MLRFGTEYVDRGQDYYERRLSLPLITAGEPQARRCLRIEALIRGYGGIIGVVRAATRRVTQRQAHAAQDAAQIA